MSVAEISDASIDLAGLTVTNLQEEVSVGDSSITGTLLYVTGYTGFSTDESLQDGNFLALHLEADVSDVTFNVTTEQPVKYLDNGDIVIRVTDEDTTLTISASKAGYQTATETLTLSLQLNNE